MGFIGRGWYPVNGANLPRLQCAEEEFQLICRFRPGGNRNAAIRHCTARQVEKSKRLAQGTVRICDRFFMRAPVDFRVASALTRLINAVSFLGARHCLSAGASFRAILYYPRKFAHINIKIVFFIRIAQVSDHRSKPWNTVQQMVVQAPRFNPLKRRPAHPSIPAVKGGT